MADEKEAWRRELAGSRARFPERPRGERPVSAERLQTPTELNLNGGDLGHRLCGTCRAAIQSGALLQVFRTASGLDQTLTQRFQNGFKDVVIMPTLPGEFSQKNS